MLNLRNILQLIDEEFWEYGAFAEHSFGHQRRKSCLHIALELSDQLMPVALSSYSPASAIALSAKHFAKQLPQ